MHQTGRTIIAWLAAIATIAFAAALARPARTAPASPSRQSHDTLRIGGTDREYLISRPADSRPLPTLIVLHGGTLSARQARTMGFEALVEREHIVTVYPDALGHRWNDGRPDFPVRAQWRSGAPDDMAFLRQLIGHLVTGGIADPARIYVTGPSNGGMTTIRLICEAADLIAGAAPAIASMPAVLAPGCKPARPVRTLIMNGTADPLMPYQGGGVGFGGNDGQVLSTGQTLAFLRDLNGCDDTNETRELAHRDKGDRTSVTLMRWEKCRSGAPVMHYRVNGGGHRLPAITPLWTPILDRLLGRQNRDLDAVEAIWGFFK
jgi:polyhydroxybutyrate depolymerase